MARLERKMRAVLHRDGSVTVEIWQKDAGAVEYGKRVYSYRVRDKYGLKRIKVKLMGKYRVARDHYEEVDEPEIKKEITNEAVEGARPGTNESG